jgi:hypothetical protein
VDVHGVCLSVTNDLRLELVRPLPAQPHLQGSAEEGVPLNRYPAYALVASPRGGKLWRVGRENEPQTELLGQFRILDHRHAAGVLDLRSVRAGEHGYDLAHGHAFAWRGTGGHGV